MLRPIKSFFLFSLIWALTSVAGYGAHVIGGVMTYTCNSPGQYTIVLKVYRDCLGGGAAFDSAPETNLVGTVTVFRGNVEFIRTINMNAPIVTTIQPDEAPCLIVPPNVCVEEGVYTFDVNLPVSSEPYTFVYQRCCRNGSISNIVSPGSVGASYFVQITPEAQAICNSSPVFDDFPPIVICNNEELIFDHSATDTSTGVQLVYSFCNPFVGGGLGGSVPGGVPGAEFLPDGVAPNPDTRPPYSPVTFTQPIYSFDRPMGGNPIVSINPNTGLITGTPTDLGQFVVGVCVREFHSGVFMSEIRRDFQFNVAVCERQVFADIENNAVLNDGTFVINSCGNLTVDFINQSTKVNFIDEYAWSFDLPGQVLEFNTRDVTVTFPDTGVYTGIMILNPNSPVQRCQDTAILQIGVFGGIEAAFDFDYDTCIAGPVTFMNQSSTENDRLVSHLWDFDDSNLSNMIDPVHTYSILGDFNVSLTVRDNRGCETTTNELIPYFPVPELVVAQPDKFVGCHPLTVTFDNKSEPVNEEYIINWNFGDGQTGEGLSVTHVYEVPGTYTVLVEIISPIGCRVEAQFRNWILVKESPQAGFVVTPEQLNALNKEASFANNSIGAERYQWFFGDGEVSIIEHPTHEYADTGIFDIILIAIADNGCTDTATAVVDVSPFSSYFLPNAFSPNDDGLNDEYAGNGLTSGIRNFNLTIWNRWGEQVFETISPLERWNGQLNNDGQPAPKGVYHCKVEYFTSRGKKETIQSPVTLLR